MNITFREMTTEELAALAAQEQIDRTRYALDPSDTAGLVRYVEFGIAPGGFLRAVICNDLQGACKQADFRNRRRIWEFVGWLYNNAPANSWKSEGAMARWLAHGGLRGLPRIDEAGEDEESPTLEA